MSFPRYPKYKASGVEWLGEVPEGWEVNRLKRVCHVFPSNVDKKSYDGETAVLLCNYTDVYYNDTIVAGTDFMAATATTAQIAQFTLRAGDTIITKDSETADDIAIAAYVPADLPGVICGYHLSMIRPTQAANGAFVKRLFDSTYVKSCVAVRANGLTRVGLGQYEIDNLDLPFPPLAEQLAIAAFLDRETAKIDELVEAQARLIELLKEKRQAVISHAVTKGLNPHAPMKPSGVEWLGEVPEHWEVVPLMRLTPDDRQIMYGIVLPGPDVDVGVPIVKGGDVAPGRLTIARLKKTTFEIEAGYVRSRLRAGDLVYSIRGSIGDAELVPAEIEGANITQDAARISPGPGVHRNWLLQVMRSAGVFGQLDASVTGATIRGINIFSLKRARIPVPPHVEQVLISDWLERTLMAMENLILAGNRAIDLLRERRSALISAAVTGQIDVRNAVTLEVA